MELNLCSHRLLLSKVQLRLLIVSILLLLCVHRCFSRDNAVKPGTDTLRIKKMVWIACKHPDPDSAIMLANELLPITTASNFNSATLDLLTIIAGGYSRKNDHANCIAANRRAMNFTERPLRKAKFLINIGNVYYTEGDYVMASKSFDSALRQLQQEPKEDPGAYLMIYNGIALLNYHIKQDSIAFIYYNKAEAIARKWKLHNELTVVLNNKGTYYQEHNKMDSALNCLLEAKDVVEKNNLKSSESDIDQGLASLYLDMGQYEKAIAYSKSAQLPEKVRYNDFPDFIYIFGNYIIGEALYHLGRYKQAENTLIPAVKKAEVLNIKDERITAYTILSDIYKATGQYKKALDCADTLTVLKESLSSLEKANAVNQLQIKYETAEKDKQLSLDQLQLSKNQLLIAHQSSKIAQKNVWMISIGGTVLLLVLIAAGVYQQTLNKQRALEKENKIGTLKAAVTGGDNERSRIARELHDGIGGMLSAAMMRFSSMHHEAPAITNTTAYKDAMGILREMGDEIRKTAHNLMPEVLLKQSLPEAVGIFCQNVQEGSTLKIDFQSFGSFDYLSQTYKLNIYRIIQELVKNITIHAHANHALVQLMHNDNKLILSVEDNGVGFDVNETKGGLGLHNIRTRVSSMDGHFILESAPGKGTTVIIEFEQEAAARQV